MKNQKSLLLIVLAFTITSCSSTKNLKFSKKADDIVTNESLKEFLSTNKNPKVVLRVNESSVNVTEDENNDYLYNAIENQLLASGFIVRDRQLFNQIIGNKENNIDYQKLKEKSDTDLIIELTKLDPKILYKTNKYYDKNDNEKIEKSYTYKRYGASVEFKVVMIKSNEFAGVYKFNYTPCSEGKGCTISTSLKQLLKDSKKKMKKEEKGYEGVERDELEIFIKDATKKLVSEMRE
jgi:hypothetical protein